MKNVNDFTKKELEVINGYIKEINRKYETTDEMESIAIKIQFMIDNYCEHDHLDDYDLFLPKVGCILTDEKKTDSNKVQLIKQIYLETVWPEKGYDDE